MSPYEGDLWIQKSEASAVLCERCAGAARVPGSAFCVECCYFYQRCINDGDVILPCAMCGEHFMVTGVKTIFCTKCRSDFPSNWEGLDRFYPNTRKFPDKNILPVLTLRLWYSEPKAYAEDLPVTFLKEPSEVGGKLVFSIHGCYYKVYSNGLVAIVDMVTMEYFFQHHIRAELLPDQQKLYE